MLDGLSCPVVTTDSFFEGSHFHRWWAPPDVLGRRLLEAAVSDLAAMGAQPRCFLVALSLPGDTELEWLTGLYGGLTGRPDCPPVGGETVGGDRLGLTLTAIGEGTERESLLRRDALAPGDLICLPGMVGRALDAPRLLERVGGLEGEGLLPARPGPTPEELERVRDFLRPRAMVRLGLELRRAGIRCAIDISDGLVSEAAHLAEESGVDVVLDLDAVPVYPGLEERGMEAATAGEDYLLLVGSPPGPAARFPELVPVGEALKGSGRLEIRQAGQPVPGGSGGWDNLAGGRDGG